MQCSCVVGIDPGSMYLGLATLWFNPRTLEIVEAHCSTLKGSGYTDNVCLNDVYGSTQSMLYGHRQSLIEHFSDVMPVGVFCESPFYNSRMPGAFGSLMGTLTFIKQACAVYDPTLLFATVDPPTAKKAIGASGGSRDKNDMLIALKSQSFYDRIFFQECSEHEVDAVAIGYWGYKNYILSS